MKTIVEKIKRVIKRKPKIVNLNNKPDINFYTYTQMVEKKAYDLYEKRGREHGRDQDDWFEAEKLIEHELCL